MCPAIRDEIVTAFDEVLDLKGNGEHGFDMTAMHSPCKYSEWQSVPALSAVQKVICRTSNRIFVGHPLCMFFFLVIVSYILFIHRSQAVILIGWS